MTVARESRRDQADEERDGDEDSPLARTAPGDDARDDRCRQHDADPGSGHRASVGEPALGRGVVRILGIEERRKEETGGGSEDCNRTRSARGSEAGEHGAGEHRQRSGANRNAPSRSRVSRCRADVFGSERERELEGESGKEHDRVAPDQPPEHVGASVGR